MSLTRPPAIRSIPCERSLSYISMRIWSILHFCGVSKTATSQLAIVKSSRHIKSLVNVYDSIYIAPAKDKQNTSSALRSLLNRYKLFPAQAKSLRTKPVPVAAFATISELRCACSRCTYSQRMFHTAYPAVSTHGQSVPHEALRDLLLNQCFCLLLV